MEIQFQSILTNCFVVCFGLTSGQLQNQVVNQIITSHVNNDGRPQERFQTLFNPITHNRTETNEIYRKILKQEVTNERQAFDSMKEELEMARMRKVFENKYLNKQVKRETKKKASKAGKKKTEKKADKLPDKKANKRSTARPTTRSKKLRGKHPDEHSPKKNQEESYKRPDSSSEEEQVELRENHEENIESKNSSEDDESLNMWEPMKVKAAKDEEIAEMDEDDVQFGGGDDVAVGDEEMTEDGKYKPPFADDTPCPISNQGVTTSDNTTEAPEWEFYYNTDDYLSNDTFENSTQTMGGITYLDSETHDGPVTPPYGPNPEDMRTKSELSGEDDPEYLQSEWRQKWAEKSDDERFEEALQHTKRETLVNWYLYAQEQMEEVEEMKRHAAVGNCEHSVLSEPIEVVELRLSRAMRSIAKYIAKFDHGEATGEKLI